MLTGVVCYVERTPGGSGIRRVRLVGPELDQSWAAPSSGGDAGREPAMGEQLASLRSAAAWIAEELSPVRELAALCVDSEGSVCSWVSAPSSDPSVVLAAVRQVGAAGSAPGESAPASGFGLLPEDALGFGSARSLQALAPPEPRTAPSLLGAGAKHAAAAPRKRLGVLSAADAPVRVLLDELDRLKIEVGAVLSLWHAEALAWDPGVAGRAGARHPKAKENGAAGAHEPIVLEAAAPVTAVVLIDPAGRLTWAWSRAGDLLAAGAMRLRTHTLTSTLAQVPAPIDVPAPPAPGELLTPELATGTRRISADEPAESVHAAECSVGDVGRLVMDWLAWSVQIGHTPERVVCIGPATIPHRPAPGEPPPTPASLAAALAAAWPDAAVDAAVHADPVGATLNRLRALAMFTPSKVPAEAPALNDDPRLNLVALTRRPGRLDRAMHRWAALGILAAAGAVVLYTRRVGSGIEDLRSRATRLQADRLALLQSVETMVPAVSKTGDPIGMLSGRIQEITEQLNRVTTAQPLLKRLQPALEVLQDPEFSAIEITSIHATDIQLLIHFTVPKGDEGERIPGQIRAKIDERTSPGVWDGDWAPSVGQRRPYEIRSRFAGGPGR